MSDNWVEVEIKATNAAGDTAVRHLEYDAQASTTEAAATEIVDHVIKQAGNNRTHIPDLSR